MGLGNGDGIKTDLRNNGTEHIVWKPGLRTILSMLLPILVVVGGIVKGGEFYRTVQDTCKKQIQLERGIKSNAVKIDTINIEMVVVQSENREILERILQKVDPVNADRTIKSIRSRREDLLKQLKEKLKKNGNSIE